MYEKHRLQQPLLAANDAVYNPSNHDIFLRLLLVFSIGVLSLWANHEFSKGFEIKILNANKSSPAGRRFELFYVSNCEASRLVHEANDFVTHILCPTKATNISRVNVQLASNGLHGRDYKVDVLSSGENLEFLLEISPTVMQESDFKYKMRRVIQRGVAELWIYKGNGVPREILDGMVEYVVVLAGLGNPFGELKIVKKHRSGGVCWKGKDSKFVADLLSYCEERKKGFIGRFYERVIKNECHQRILDEELGMGSIALCGSFLSSCNL